MDFEDALQSSETSNHAITLDFEGQIMYKESVLRLISTGVGLKKSGDRLRRVQGLSKYWKVIPYTNDSVKESDTIIAKYNSEISYFHR